MKNECKNISPKLVDYLDKRVSKEEEKMIHDHLSSCASCSKELEQLVSLFADMKHIQDEDPPSSVKERFYNMLEEEKALQQKPVAGSHITIPRFIYRIAASFALLVTGLAIGLLLPHSNEGGQAELVNLQQQVGDLQRTVVLARLDQQSPSQRILAASTVKEKGVADEEVIDALITTMEGDENVNVRMSAMHALFRFRNIPRVKKALVDGLEKQTDPVLQVTLINMMVEMQEERAIQMMMDIINKEETIPAVRDMAEKGIKSIQA